MNLLSQNLTSLAKDSRPVPFIKSSMPVWSLFLVDTLLFGNLWGLGLDIVTNFLSGAPGAADCSSWYLGGTYTGGTVLAEADGEVTNTG